ncbi:MAG: hypothetical protein OEZ06_32680 [Myxococcales bacterium]|nr:hypothetical protein [Myxococcales bacterium]
MAERLLGVGITITEMPVARSEGRKRRGDEGTGVAAATPPPAAAASGA